MKKQFFSFEIFSPLLEKGGRKVIFLMLKCWTEGAREWNSAKLQMTKPLGQKSNCPKLPFEMSQTVTETIKNNTFHAAFVCRWGNSTAQSTVLKEKNQHRLLHIIHQCMIMSKCTTNVVTIFLYLGLKQKMLRLQIWICLSILLVSREKSSPHLLENSRRTVVS